MTTISSRLGGIAFLVLVMSAARALAQPGGAASYQRACAQCHESGDTERRRRDLAYSHIE